MPGARIVLKGEGCIRIGLGRFCAEGAEFIGEGILTNSWRISANGGRIELVNCRFKGLATFNPGGARWFHGGVSLTSPDVRVAGCRFEGMQSLTLVNAGKAEIVDNLFSCTDKGLYLLNSPEARVERNVFNGGNGAQQGMEIAGSPHVTVVHNRFTGLQVGVYARSASSYSVLAGNVFEGCARALSAVDSKGTTIVDHRAINR
jgi:nitrous oxidase accessory protein NosD